MTPERIAEIFAEETGGDINEASLCMEDFARRMWNEALEEAAKVCTDYGAMYCQIAIRALKLPENP